MCNRGLLRHATVLAALACASYVLSTRDLRAESSPAGWAERFAFQPPEVSTNRLCRPSSEPLPSFAVTPAAAGRQLVRVSLPFSPGVFPAGASLLVRSGGQDVVADVRPLTWHPGLPRSVRRAMITFVYDFADGRSRRFEVGLSSVLPKPSGAASQPARAVDRFQGRLGDLDIGLKAGLVEVTRRGRQLMRAELIAPAHTDASPVVVEVIEQGASYLWARLLVPDANWPRILELRADALGTVAIRGHLQRMQQTSDGRPRVPDVGWRISGPRVDSLVLDAGREPVEDVVVVHDFSGGQPASIEMSDYCLDFPDAHLHKRGELSVQNSTDRSVAAYLRCHGADLVPHQLTAWRTATFVLRPKSAAPLNALLEPAHRVEIPAESFAALYGSGVAADLTPWPALASISQYHRDAIASCLLPGDDYGNVASMPTGAVFGMNRLNHCPAMFEEYYRSGDARLRSVALQWCGNMHDLSIWWNANEPNRFGGTRYNNMAAHNPQYSDDKSFMWRSDNAVDFCTKGVDSFYYAYEETGDPRMAHALRWQTAFALSQIHVEREMRNIGDVLDFIRLYRFTGKPEYLDGAVRLFLELRTHLSPDNLFDQGGKPVEEDVHFIAEDAEGTKYGYAKPYIIGYALAGLPALARYYPAEPRLVDVVRAVSRFMADAQDPVGGWRYPHPRSPHVILGQAIEHAAQIVSAAALLEERGESIEHLLDAIECTLRARILVWQRTGQFFSGLGSWEQAAGLIKETASWYELYKRPEDRDRSRDYTEGAIGLGSAPPEGVVYFPSVLAFYLAHRPAERLFHANEIQQQVLDRLPPATMPARATQPSAEYLRHGVEAFLPTFRDNLIRRLSFPLRYDPEKWPDFNAWRQDARQTLLRCLLKPPPRADFAPVVIAREDRGAYEARKLVFSVSADCRIPAYLLVPKGKGPFPAVVALHDHGAYFLIGKEKVIRPFDERPEIIDAAQQWADKCCGGRFFGDELAKRGYVVFAADALFWGDRGRKEGVDYTAQQALSSNLIQMGMTWPGVITWDDIRSADFVATLPEVDPRRIAAMGLSMGCHRTWMLSAATDRIAAGVAICWMGTTETLMAPGNNQTKGHSSYSMLVPDLRNYLDYPDVASIACPKPMLFFNGDQDGLFPVKGVQDAYARMRAVWASQGASGRLTTRLWPRPHVFDVEMQDTAFAWLDRQLKGKP